MTTSSPDWSQITFSSTVPSELRAAVESLFFFNPKQVRIGEAIQAAIDRTGLPQISEADGRIWISTSKGLTQCLFACDGRLRTNPPAGVALYCRPSVEVISIAHLAIGVNYTLNGRVGRAGLGSHMIEEIARIAHRIRGVQRIELPYLPGRFIEPRL